LKKSSADSRRIEILKVLKQQQFHEVTAADANETKTESNKISQHFGNIQHVGRFLSNYSINNGRYYVTKQCQRNGDLYSVRMIPTLCYNRRTAGRCLFYEVRREATYRIDCAKPVSSDWEFERSETLKAVTRQRLFKTQQAEKVYYI
jgi:hypothetical protein